MRATVDSSMVKALFSNPSVRPDTRHNIHPQHVYVTTPDATFAINVKIE